MKGAGISRDLKQMIAYIASLASGCRYCQAHTAQGNARVGIDTAKTRLALLAGQTPNAVEDEDFKAAREYFDDDQLVEIVAVIAFFGFANRWNDTLATPLEDLPLAFARDELATAGWEVGKHSTRART